MSNSSKKINKRLPFDKLPSEFIYQLEQFNNKDYIADDILPEIKEIKISLLDAINNQEISSGYFSKHQNTIRCNINELIVWIGNNFSVCIKKEFDSIFEPKITSKRICLVYFKEFERYDFIWDQDIENKINVQSNTKPIENYKNMLSEVINFKKEMRQKIKYLPYLGVKNDRGNWFLLDKKICRPNYNKIKADPCITLKICICTLLGINNLSLIVSKNSHLNTITNSKGKKLREDDFMEFPFVHADKLSGDIKNTIKYREGWCDVISFIEKFVFKIIKKSNTGFIEWFDHSSLTGYTSFSLHDIDQETHKCYFKTLPFLKWAKKAGYAIPDELSVIENDDGTLQWADPDQTNGINYETHKQAKNKTKQNYNFPGKQISSWEDLKVILTSYQTVNILTKHDSIKLSFQQLGMARKQNPEKPKEVWQTLMLFAQLDGKYPNIDVPEARLKNAKDRVRAFNVAIKKIFNLNTNIYKNHYKKNKCWETKFVIKSQLDTQHPRQESKSSFEIEVEDAQRKSNISDSQLYQD